MDAVLMCGGRGSRLGRGEKPLFEVGGEPMVDRVRRALAESRIDDVYAATSPHAPETTAHLEETSTASEDGHDGTGRGVECIETAGDGYVADLSTALEEVGTPALTVVSDLPLLSGAVVDRALDVHDRRGGSLTVCVPTALKRSLGVSADATTSHDGQELSPVGLNVVADDGTETVHVSYDTRLAVGVERPDDAAVAEVLVDGSG